MQTQSDYIALCLLTIAAFAAVMVWLRRTRGLRLPTAVLACAGIALALGWIPVQKAGEAEAHRVRGMLMGFAPTYAMEMRRLGHERVRYDTPLEDPFLQQLMAVQSDWLKLNASIMSIYTMRQRADGQWIFIVAAAVDYDRNGVYEGEREQPSVPGDVYVDATDFWVNGLQGRTAFDSEPYTDQWGTWVSAVTPLYDSQGKIEGVLGVDYDANFSARGGGATLGGDRHLGLGVACLALAHRGGGAA